MFAELYFAAVDAAGGAMTRAWVPVFEARGKRRVAPIQFALAGMNSHINHDLRPALVAACRELGVEPKTNSPQHRDYLQVNEILERVQDAVKVRYATGLAGMGRLPGCSRADGWLGGPRTAAADAVAVRSAPPVRRVRPHELDTRSS